MMTPTIHTNGTARNALLDQLTEASMTLLKAMRGLADAAPNGRDYYPQGPDAMQAATAEHADRLRRIESVKSEIDALAIAVCDAP